MSETYIKTKSWMKKELERNSFWFDKRVNDRYKEKSITTIST